MNVVCAKTPPNLAVTAATVVNPHKSERVKRMSKALRASALVLLLACSARAGWMPYGTPEPPPPPPPPSIVQEEQIETADNQDATLDGAVEVVSSLLASLSSLF
jgi:hypothetical protein